MEICEEFLTFKNKNRGKWRDLQGGKSGSFKRINSNKRIVTPTLVQYFYQFNPSISECAA